MTEFCPAAFLARMDHAFCPIFYVDGFACSWASARSKIRSILLLHLQITLNPSLPGVVGARGQMHPGASVRSTKTALNVSVVLGRQNVTLTQSVTISSHFLLQTPVYYPRTPCVPLPVSAATALALVLVSKEMTLIRRQLFSCFFTSSLRRARVNSSPFLRIAGRVV